MCGNGHVRVVEPCIKSLRDQCAAQVEQCALRRTPESPEHGGIDFVAATADGRPEVDPYASARGAEPLERLDPPIEDISRDAAPSRVQEAEEPRFRIEKVDRYAVRSRRCQENAGIGRHEAVEPSRKQDTDARVAGHLPTNDHIDVVAVYLAWHRDGVETGVDREIGVRGDQYVAIHRGDREGPGGRGGNPGDQTRFERLPLSIPEYPPVEELGKTATVELLREQGRSQRSTRSIEAPRAFRRSSIRS